MDISILVNEESYCWNRGVELTKRFIKRQEDYANRKLRHNGHLFLNEVYDMIGHPRTNEGYIFGWISSERVKFHIEEADSKPYFLLVLNPEGEVLGLT